MSGYVIRLPGNQKLVLACRAMIKPPDRRLLDCLAAYSPHVSDLTLALREVVLEEAPDAIESIVQGYAVALITQSMSEDC